jgi:rod shape-determining protein MreC
MGRYYEKANVLREYLSLRSNNDYLVAENARLRKSLLESKVGITAPVLEQNDSLLYHQRYQYTPANIINCTTNKQYNFITIDKGSLAGIRPEMGVISAEGVVGIVDNVTEHFSTVISVLNRNIKISGRFKSNKFFGSFEWPGDNYKYGKLNEIPLHVPVAKGDTILTTGYSSIFPEGIAIGYVDKYKVSGGNFYDIDIRISTDFKRITQVYVVTDLMKTEVDSLEIQKSKE